MCLVRFVTSKNVKTTAKAVVSAPSRFVKQSRGFTHVVHPNHGLELANRIKGKVNFRAIGQAAMELVLFGGSLAAGIGLSNHFLLPFIREQIDTDEEAYLMQQLQYSQDQLEDLQSLASEKSVQHAQIKKRLMQTERDVMEIMADLEVVRGSTDALLEIGMWSSSASFYYLVSKFASKLLPASQTSFSLPRRSLGSSVAYTLVFTAAMLSTRQLSLLFRNPSTPPTLQIAEEFSLEGVQEREELAEVARLSYEPKHTAKAVIYAAWRQLCGPLNHQPAFFHTESPNAVSSVWLHALQMCAVGPFLEEVVFRGLLFRRLLAVPLIFSKAAAWSRPLMAYLLANGVFSLAHLAGPRQPHSDLGQMFCSHFLVALPPTYLFFATGRLLPAVFIHAVQNSWTLGYGLASDLTPSRFQHLNMRLKCHDAVSHLQNVLRQHAVDSRLLELQTDSIPCATASCASPSDCAVRLRLQPAAYSLVYHVYQGLDSSGRGYLTADDLHHHFDRLESLHFYDDTPSCNCLCCNSLLRNVDATLHAFGRDQPGLDAASSRIIPFENFMLMYTSMAVCCPQQFERMGQVMGIDVKQDSGSVSMCSPDVLDRRVEFRCKLESK
eukprot:TRINITY_DN1522_c0_g1_i4.p1 TRINITY_DN1522_c0_g1~~TRINITY_DN1522_c0_g1_i4.p1  ORF type:complete len:608 (+),score=150.94 TRINITY_DN1522_c0_g1_i4:109-1932(+)